MSPYKHVLTIIYFHETDHFLIITHFASKGSSLPAPTGELYGLLCALTSSMRFEYTEGNVPGGVWRWWLEETVRNIGPCGAGVRVLH